MNFAAIRPQVEKKMKKAIRNHGLVAGFRGGKDYHDAMQAFLLKHGRFWQPHPLPDQYEMGRQVAGAAFANASFLAVMNKELRYVEGFAYGFDTGTRYLLHHGWCVDAEDRVVDPTWGIGVAYFGVAVQLSLACRMTGKVPNALQLTSHVWAETGGKLPPAPVAGFAKRKPIDQVAKASQGLADRAESVGVYVNGPDHVVACGRERAALQGVTEALRGAGWTIAGELKPRDRRDPFWAVEIESSQPVKDVPAVDRLLWTTWLSAAQDKREVGERIQPEGKLLRALTYKAMEKYALPTT